jgi:hypothetical protein
MALKKNFVLQFNDESIVLTDAYCKVHRVLGSKDELHYDINVMDAADGKSYRILSYEFKPDMNGENFIRQAYLHAKTLPEFEGATDC